MKITKLIFAMVTILCLLIFSAPTLNAKNISKKINYPAYMQGIDYGTEITYVIGHKPPDSDTICTAIAYANLKRKLGINCEARISAIPNAETAYALNYFEVPVPEILNNAAGKNIILVDHNSFAQAIPGMKDANILEIIDHHNLIGDVKTSAPVYYRNMPVGCTSTIVWLSYLESNVAIDKPMAGMMLSAILSDTDNLQSNTTTTLDRQAVDYLKKKAEIKDCKKYFLDMEEEFAAYKDMTEKEIFYSDYKEFESGGLKYGCATVVALTPEKRNNLKDKLDKWMKENFSNQKMDMVFLKIHDLETYTAEISAYGEGAQECAEKAFRVDADGHIYLNPNISRKKVVKFLNPVIKNFAEYNDFNKAA